jgi:hypothetical protein
LAQQLADERWLVHTKTPGMIDALLNVAVVRCAGPVHCRVWCKPGAEAHSLTAHEPPSFTVDAHEPGALRKFNAVDRYLVREAKRVGLP